MPIMADSMPGNARQVYEGSMRIPLILWKGYNIVN